MKIKGIQIHCELDDLQAKRLKSFIAKYESRIWTLHDNQPFFLEGDGKAATGFIKDETMYVESFNESVKELDI